jgi:hypothetical protein
MRQVNYANVLFNKNQANKLCPCWQEEVAELGEGIYGGANDLSCIYASACVFHLHACSLFG